MSTIKIYQTHLTLDRNALVDDIDSYLNSCLITYHNDNFQYIKLGLDIPEFKINIHQSNITHQTLGNYVRIQQDGKSWYYFILDAKWLGVSTVSLNLSIDSVNTFRNDLEWSEKTSIVRQHKNRFDIDKQTANFYVGRITPSSTGIRTTSYSLTREQYKDYYLTKTSPRWISQDSKLIDYNVNMSRSGNIRIDFTYQVFKVPTVATFSVNAELIKVVNKIDFTPEGIEPVLYGKDLGEVRDGHDGDSWYLIYNSQAEDQPVETLLCKGSGCTVLVPTGENQKEVILNPSDVEVSKYYFLDARNGNFYRIFNNYWENDDPLRYQSIYNEYNEEIGRTHCLSSTRYSLSFKSEGDHFELYKIRYFSEGLTERTTSEKIGIAHTLRITSEWSFKIFIDDKLPADSGTDINKFDTSRTLPVKEQEKIPVYIDGIELLDRTKTTLIKIIKLPYCPLNYTINRLQQYDFEVDVQSSLSKETLGGTFISVPSNVEFGHQIDTILPNILATSHKTVKLDSNPNTVKNINNETKLFHSTFYQPRVVYDSFSFQFDLEKIRPQDFQRYLQINYTASRIFNSTFMLSFPEYRTDALDTQDYNNVLICDRNNEMPIYSNAYLNYVRNGYNYDVKAKKQEQTMNWLSTGLQIAGAVASFALTPFTGGTSAAAGVALTVSATSQIAHNISSQTASERALQQKINEKKLQATAVSSCDDVDILTAYSYNKAKLKLYTVSEQVRQSLFDLFYYTGYTVGLKGKPDFNSRYWFNYVQCEPTFKDEPVSIYNNFINDIKARYSAGITVYHHTRHGWDWEQEHENLETELVDEDAVVFNTSMISQFSYTPERGIFAMYNGDTTLDGVNTYFQAQIIQNGKIVYAATSKGIILEKGVPYISGKLSFTSGTARVKIFDANRPWNSSDWLETTI